MASVGVVVSPVFVGLQVRQNTAALYRNEHNSTMQQWTVIRMAIAQHRGTRGSVWWRDAKHIDFVPAYVMDVDAQFARHVARQATDGAKQKTPLTTHD